MTPSLTLSVSLQAPCWGAHQPMPWGEAGNIGDLLGLDPLALFGDRGRTVICALRNGAHMLHFGRVNHNDLPLLILCLHKSGTYPYVFFIIANPNVFCKAKNGIRAKSVFLSLIFRYAALFVTAGGGSGAGQRSESYTARALPKAASFLQTARRIPCRRRAGRGGPGPCIFRSLLAARH